MEVEKRFMVNGFTQHTWKDLESLLAKANEEQLTLIQNMIADKLEAKQ